MSAPRGNKRRPQARLRAVSAGEDAASAPAHGGQISEWASLFGDLARRTSIAPAGEGPPVEWRVHDRTHLEFAIDYPIAEGPRRYTWEAYFFVPESFRLHEDTYDKKAIYNDLWSYVRYDVPAVKFYDLARRDARSSLGKAELALEACAGKAAGSREAAEAMRRLRLFACLVRASGLSAMREVEQEIDAPERDPKVKELIPPSCAPPCDGRLMRPSFSADHGSSEDRLVGAGVSFVTTSAEVTRALRDVLGHAESLALPDDVRTAARWIDEDVSLVIETFCASLGISIGGADPHASGEGSAARRTLAEKLAARAVEEARHRKARGMSSVGVAGARDRDVEHLEFRRHVLKRFTSSVLWLSLQVREGAAWVVHALYAVAAALAMAFALGASFSTTPGGDSFFRYAVIVVLAYAVKDRMKAFLQNVFAGWIAKRFPDRKWTIFDRERGREVGSVHERAGFLPFRSLPAEVLERRRVTREHALEEQARPERVLWHQKTVEVEPVKRDESGGESADFRMMTEIFRLNLRPWLVHTDDPNRAIVFADPDDALVYSATARRVYNINVVYRLNAEGPGSSAPWHRLRLVVSRKGIERIEPIDAR